MSFWGYSSFQNIVSAKNSYLESLHDLIMVWLIIIITIVMMMGTFILNNKIITNLPLENKVLEVTWTIIPVFVLFSIAVPSIFLLCMQDTFHVLPKVSVKIFSSQWSWQSEQTDVTDHLLDSEKIDELSNYETPVVFPLNTLSRILLTSMDVLHSLGVPSIGVKLDSTPGRLTSTFIEVNTMGLLSGSCYELCGSGHSAMPIFMYFL